jgi:hypothetical protein
VYSGEKRRT